ncbi:MAG TPA: transposase [Xanthobacteraceae bacterium]|jgi:hypothetical protein|nr:transposase [Xanthobacteraceae bacterium]
MTQDFPDHADAAERKASIVRLTRDLKAAAVTMSEQEARFLVDGYYSMQDDRKRANNQSRAMADEPHTLVVWLAEQGEMLEGQIKRALETYSDAHAIGRWMKSIYGIGPVIAAGMLAHIDITRAPTAGHIWSYAGLDPSTQWLKGEKRPWNAALKTLCWKTGQSFMKFSNQEECVYGAVYRKRKEFEMARNDRGQNAETATRLLTEKKFSKATEAYKSLSQGRLPPGQIDGRARRYAVKLFLSHLQTAWWFDKFQELPPRPYAIAHLDHAHFIGIPNAEIIEGLPDALRARGWMQ